jgi:FkbM family methyltransferase
MKSRVIKILHKLLGFDNYLFLFSVFTIHTLRWNRKEGDFLFFLRMIPDGETVLDIGANIGIMTVWLSRRLKNTSIIAFEPMPQNIRALKRIMQFYKLQNVRLVENALGDQRGTIEMVMPVLDKVKKHGLSHVVHESIQELNEGNTVRVNMERLDDLSMLHEKDIKIRAIKLDVENFEYFVLQGGKQLIQKHRPLIYTELWENENRNLCFQLIQEMGYRIEVLEGKKLVPFEDAKNKTQNFFFIP